MAKENVTTHRLSCGVDDYGYINARIKAMRSNLLGRTEVERLLNAENLELLNSMLSGSEYGRDIKASEQKLAKGMRRLDVMEDGLKQNFIRTMAKIYSFLDGTPAELTGIILGHWDIFNFKTIIRGKYVDQSPAEIIQCLFFVGTFSREYLEKLAKKKDMKEVLDNIATSPMLPPRVAFDKYMVANDLMGIELLLEKSFYKNALNVCIQIGEDCEKTRRYLRSEIDIVNIMTCLRLSREDIDRAEALKFYIPGGVKFKQDDFTTLIAAGDVDKILSWVERMLLIKDGLAERVKLYRKLDDISIFERFFEVHILTELRSQAMGDPLGFNVLMSYLRLKYNELINLRIVLRAVEFGLPREIVNQELVFV